MLTRKSKKSLFHLLISIVIALSSTNSFALNQLDHNQQLKSQIAKNFLISGSISIEKIDKYESSINIRRNQIITALTNSLRLLEDKSPKKIKKKIKKEKTLKKFKILKKYIQKLRGEKDLNQFKRLARITLEIDYSLKVEGVKLGSFYAYQFTKNSLKKWKLPANNSAPEGEASNLVDPKTKLFFSQEELESQKARGFDISKYNPPKSSTFWTEQNIEKINIVKHYEGGTKLYEGIDLWFPTTHAKFKKVRHTQSKPKLDVTFVKDGEKRTFKLKLGTEMHSEITSSALFAAIGYQTDVSRYVRDFKIKLGEMTPNEFKVAWNKYYSSWAVDDYIKEEGRDADGYFITFIEGLLESKPKELNRVGPWAWGSNGHKGNRGTRGILIFNMWVANLDLKEAENNKMIMKKGEDGKYEMYHLQQDMGYAFAKRLVREKPGAYRWDLVKKKTNKFVHINFNNFQQNTGFSHVTKADAKWMTRLIARLSRKQISQAVRLGGWPESINQLLTEKLVTRRNQLVSAFDLDKEFSQMPFNRLLTTKDGAVVNGELIRSHFKGYTQSFGGEFEEYLDELTTALKHASLGLIQKGIELASNYEINAAEFGFDEGIINKIILNTNRSITRNPSPKSHEDLYIVKDTLRIGMRLGFGFVLSGDVAYVKEYSIIYPVKKKTDPVLRKNFINHLFLPHTLKKEKDSLPNSYVLKLEDWMEGRGRLKLSSGSIFGLGTEKTVEKIKLTRTLIDRTNKNKLNIITDQSAIKRFGGEIFAKLLIAKIPVFNHSLSKGGLKRELYTLNTSKFTSSKVIEESVDKIIASNKITGIKNLIKKTQITTKFKEKFRRLNLLSMFQIRKTNRVDEIVDRDIRTSKVDNTYQVENEIQRSWNILDNGERHYSSINFSAQTDTNGRISKPILKMKLWINDFNTKPKEMVRYIKMLNRVSLNEKFIDFTPGLHSKNKYWGNVNVFMDIVVHESGIKTLINSNEEQMWSALSSVTGISKKTLKNPAPLNSITRGNRRNGADRFKKIQYISKKYKAMIKSINKAKAKTDMKQKIQHLVYALRESVFHNAHTFNSILITSLHKVIGNKNLLMKGLITLPEDEEMKFPARLPLYNETGKAQDSTKSLYDFRLDDGDQIYNLFEKMN